MDSCLYSKYSCLILRYDVMYKHLVAINYKMSCFKGVLIKNINDSKARKEQSHLPIKTRGINLCFDHSTRSGVCSERGHLYTSISKRRHLSKYGTWCSVLSKYNHCKSSIKLPLSNKPPPPPFWSKKFIKYPLSFKPLPLPPFTVPINLSLCTATTLPSGKIASPPIFSWGEYLQALGEILAALVLKNNDNQWMYKYVIDQSKYVQEAQMIISSTSSHLH